MNLNPPNNNDFDANAQGVEVVANNVNLFPVSFDGDDDDLQVTDTELPFGDDDAKAKAEEYVSSSEQRQDQVAATASFFGITGFTHNKKFLIGGLVGSAAALLALSMSIPSMKDSHISKDSAAVVEPFASAKAAKSSGGGGGETGGTKSSKSSGGGGGDDEYDFDDDDDVGGGCPISCCPEIGDPLSCYERVGGASFGICLDSTASRHDYSAYSSVDGPASCAATCNDCVLFQLPSASSFRGFQFDENDAECFCLFDHNEVLSTTCSPSGSSSGGAMGGGTGPITQIGGGSGVLCYAQI
mmetsp:Transcript_6644/g.10140  ORF Transcript_6644/g.10140 Transcript_6644/m.10140 type:complete len:299 (-) Transcript_6644:177-1073(-)